MIQGTFRSSLIMPVLLLVACSAVDDSYALGEPNSERSTSTTIASAPSTIVTITAISSTSVEPVRQVAGWDTLDGPADVEGAHHTLAAAAQGVTVLSVCDSREASLGRDGALTMWWADSAKGWQPISLPLTDRCIGQIEHTPFGFFAKTAGLDLWSEDGKAWQVWDVVAELNPELVGQNNFHAIFPSPAGSRVTLLLFDHAPVESTIATLITSTDGESWELGPETVADQFDNATIAGVHPGGDGLLAFGSSPGVNSHRLRPFSHHTTGWTGDG